MIIKLFGDPLDRAVIDKLNRIKTPLEEELAKTAKDREYAAITKKMASIRALTTPTRILGQST